MSNPLLHPGDPRFTRPSIVDADGKNVFAETEATKENDPNYPKESAGNLYSSSVQRASYQPQYVASQQHRGSLLLTMAIVSLVGDVVGVSSLAEVWRIGWLFTALSVVPAGCAWLLGLSDLRLMRLGAMNSAGQTRTRLAKWLGLLGIFGSVGVVAAMIASAIYYGTELF